jgi:hypothetical protein
MMWERSASNSGRMVWHAIRRAPLVEFTLGSESGDAIGVYVNLRGMGVFEASL